MKHVYEAIAEREHDWWIITVPEIDQVTQARVVSEIDTMARDLVAAILDVEEDEVEVSVKIQMPVDIQTAWQRAEALQAEVDAVSRQAATLRRQAVRSLLEQKISQRDAARLLGISPQRVQQLAKAG